VVAPFRFDRTWRFDVPVDRLWTAAADTGSFPAMFRWLRDYDAGPLETGMVATFRVRPPLPYTLHFVVTVTDVVTNERVEARVGGDVRGPAQLVVSPTADGSQARLAWNLEVVRPMLRRITPVARHPMIWGHDAVVAMGLRRFRREALA
jgi:hypothetical protein